MRRPYAVLTEPELAALLQAADNARDRALLAVLAGAGLRAAEAVGLDVGDVLEGHEGGHALHVRSGKGRKSRTVPIQDDVARLLRAYIAGTGRTLASEGPVFRAHDFYAGNRPRQRLTTRALEHVVGRTARRAGIVAKRVTPHSLRHTFAIRALRHGAEVTALAKLLGHANVSTTMRYVDHLETAELRSGLPSLPDTASRANGPRAAGLSSPDYAQRACSAPDRQAPRRG